MVAICVHYWYMWDRYALLMIHLSGACLHLTRTSHPLTYEVDALLQAWPGN